MMLTHVLRFVVQIEELMTPVVYFVRDTGDPSYTVSVVSLVKNAVQLSCRPGTSSMSIDSTVLSSKICMRVKAVYDLEFG